MTDKEHFIETYKSLITLAVEAFKFLVLMNGGAAVAILAYLGKDGAAPDMMCPMIFFVFGLVFCGVALVSGYLTQFRLLNECVGRGTGWFPHMKSWWVSLISACLSLGCFAFGSLNAVAAFHNAHLRQCSRTDTSKAAAPLTRPPTPEPED